MTLSLDRNIWKRVVLGDVARHITDRVNPETSGLERFLAGEHIPSDSLQIREWGLIGRDPLGPMFYKRFKPGHVLYVSRRAYLRKTAVPEFEGICSEKTFVLETRDPGTLSQRFLPFVLSSDHFHGYAVAMSRGSVNPYINWTDLAAYEFDLPPLDEQERLANLLWTVEHSKRTTRRMRLSSNAVRRHWLDDEVRRQLGITQVPFERIWSRSPESGRSIAPVDEPTGRFVLSLAALGPDGYRAGHVKNIPDSAEFNSVTLRHGDLLISRANTVDTVGRVGIFSEDRDDVSFPDTMMRLHLVDAVLPDFAAAVLCSGHGRDHMRRTAAGSATSMVKINRNSLGKFAFPVTPLGDQQAIIRDLSCFDKAVAALDRELDRIMRLNAALLDELFGRPA